MVTIINRSGTKIFKFSDTDRKDLKVNFKFAVQQGNNIRGFKTLTQVNRALGSTRKELRITPSSFKKKGKKA